MIRSSTAAGAVLYAAMLAAPVYAVFSGDDFVISLATRIVVFAIAALSLGFILGFGGMVSFGHAVFIGIGSYAIGILAVAGIGSGFGALALAVLACGLAALIIGSVSLRTSGASFIMITLAFSQVFYFAATSISAYGGDDGMSLAAHTVLGPLDLGQPLTLYAVALAVLAAAHLGFARLLCTPFGEAIEGIRQDDLRMRALGFPTYRYRLAAFVLAGLVGGLSGILFANEIGFISPNAMGWERSGDLIVMVVLGGSARLVGPILGAAILVLLEYFFSEWTAHWPILIGIVAVCVVRFGRRGLLGLLGDTAAS